MMNDFISGLAIMKGLDLLKHIITLGHWLGNRYCLQIPLCVFYDFDNIISP